MTEETNPLGMESSDSKPIKEFLPNKEPVKDKQIIDAMFRAQFGSPEQSASIEDHMKEYFTRWPNYKDKFTHLEWYHIFLDFSDYIQKAKSIPVKESEQEKGIVMQDIPPEINKVLQEGFWELVGDVSANDFVSSWRKYCDVINETAHFTRQDVINLMEITSKSAEEKIKELQAEVDRLRIELKVKDEVIKDQKDEIYLFLKI